MKALVTTEGKKSVELLASHPKKWKKLKVVTLADIDNLHRKASGTARKNFSNHRERFDKNLDYFELTAPDIKKFYNECEFYSQSTASNRGGARSMILFTEMGYIKMTKLFDDDYSWAIFNELMHCYFRVKKALSDATELDLMKKMILYLEKKSQEQKEIEMRLEALENGLNNQQALAIWNGMNEEFFNRGLGEKNVTRILDAVKRLETVENIPTLNAPKITVTESAKKSNALPEGYMTLEEIAEMYDFIDMHGRPYVRFVSILIKSLGCKIYNNGQEHKDKYSVVIRDENGKAVLGVNDKVTKKIEDWIAETNGGRSVLRPVLFKKRDWRGRGGTVKGYAVVLPNKRKPGRNAVYEFFIRGLQPDKRMSA